MENKKPELTDVEIELDDEHLEYLKRKNLDLNELIRKMIDELIGEENNKKKIKINVNDIVNIKLSDGFFHQSSVIQIIPQKLESYILPSRIRLFCKEYQRTYEIYEYQLEFKNGEYYEIDFPATPHHSCSLL